jgi:hypothetical protein
MKKLKPHTVDWAELDPKSTIGSRNYQLSVYHALELCPFNAARLSSTSGRRVRSEMFRRIGWEDLLNPRGAGGTKAVAMSSR